MRAYEVAVVDTIEEGARDGALLLAASWENRCTGVAERLGRKYRAEQIVMTVYDGQSARREENTAKLRQILKPAGTIKDVGALHRDPLANVCETITYLQDMGLRPGAAITIDVSCYTRMHLLQLLQGLELADLIGNIRFLYSQPVDYYTSDNEPISKGITSVRAIRAFAGTNRPSRDSLLILFLGYEGRRAQALWDHLEPNQAIVVIADPPYQADWRGRAEEQNRYLLSLVPPERVVRSSFCDPGDTERLLLSLHDEPIFAPDLYNYQIAPLGTKGQLLGIYRFWRLWPRRSTLMYASPVRYRDDRPQFEAARVLCLDESRLWPSALPSPTTPQKLTDENSR